MSGCFLLLFVGTLGILRPRPQIKDDIASRRPLSVPSEKERLLGVGLVHLVVLSLMCLLSLLTPAAR